MTGRNPAHDLERHPHDHRRQPSTVIDAHGRQHIATHPALIVALTRAALDQQEHNQ